MMIGRFLRSLYVGRRTEYLLFFAMLEALGLGKLGGEDALAVYVAWIVPK